MNDRQIVLLLSIATIVFYGYALGSAFNMLIGVKNYFVLSSGIVSGSICAFLAIKIWGKRFK